MTHVIDDTVITYDVATGAGGLVRLLLVGGTARAVAGHAGIFVLRVGDMIPIAGASTFNLVEIAIGVGIVDGMYPVADRHSVVARLIVAGETFIGVEDNRVSFIVILEVSGVMAADTPIPGNLGLFYQRTNLDV